MRHAHAKENVFVRDKLVLRQEEKLVYKNVSLNSTKCNSLFSYAFKTW